MEVGVVHIFGLSQGVLASGAARALTTYDRAACLGNLMFECVANAKLSVSEGPSGH